MINKDACDNNNLIDIDINTCTIVICMNIIEYIIIILYNIYM